MSSGTEAPRIAFLTGRSDPDRCALSPLQRAVFDTLATDATHLHLDPLNFPWCESIHESIDEKVGENDCETNRAWRDTPLLRASLANGRQYLAARRGDFADLPQTVVAQARECLSRPPRSLLLVGSCGLSLLDALIAPFDDAQRARLRIVAYGGVAPRWPRGVEGAQLHGRRDRIAAWFGPNDGPQPRTIDCGHMDYLERSAALDAVLDAVRAQWPWLRGDA
ncbi:MAG: hypothetical protein IT473_01630 [Lysobacter sp.]|nr:hypothetical protein [Lysobacter sp.]